MAGGIDWFRWHHGSVTDPKFQLVARKAQARFGDVMTVWAFMLEAASANADRGQVGEVDAESIDCLLGADEGTTQRILAAMQERALWDGVRITAWDRRQPKREDETAAERKRRQREREHEELMSVTPKASRTVTPCHADVTHGHDREEKRREEKDISKPTASHPPAGGLPAGFAEFWEAWPKNERKQDKAKCAAHWKLHRLDAALILADVRIKRATEKWQDGYIEAPLVYLRGRRWEDGVTPEVEELKPANAEAERSQAYLREQAEHAATAVPPPPNLRALVRKMTGTAS